MYRNFGGAKTFEKKVFSFLASKIIIIGNVDDGATNLMLCTVVIVIVLFAASVCRFLSSVSQ